MIYLRTFLLFILSLVSVQTDSNYIFQTNELNPDDPMPSLSNGYVGFVVNSDTIYVGGVYNGDRGESHRARFPNYANIQLRPCVPSFQTRSSSCLYSLNLKDGTFITEYENDDLIAKLTVFPHREYLGAIVNQLTLTRKSATKTEAIRLVLDINPGEESNDLKVISRGEESYDYIKVTVIEYETKEVEDSLFQPDVKRITGIFPQIPGFVEIPVNENTANFKWAAALETTKDFALLSYLLALEELESHLRIWNNFWDASSISVEGNDELDKSIHASLYYLTSSMPSPAAYRRNEYGSNGLSPSGLGLNGYNGHSFWDTEIWMQPVLLMLEPEWSKMLLRYRFNLRTAAEKNAEKYNNKGLRFPWESAYTGVEVTPDCCPQNAIYEQHITGAVAFAARQYLISTHDFHWFQEIGCELVYKTAEFWTSRLEYNETTKLYEINNVMGPDEFHENVSNNAYTNVIAAQNLFFGQFASCYCSLKKPNLYSDQPRWLEFAKSIKLLYDEDQDYHPQYDDFDKDETTIKQADVVLLGYPLQYPLNKTTAENNLKIYSKATSEEGPAMTWAIHAIGGLDIQESIPENEFNRTYAPYLRKPFYTWTEVIEGYNGAGNFITGAGGFLQLIINGYGGIRLYNDELIISNPRLPPRTTQLKFNGIQYLGTKFALTVTKTGYQVNIKSNDGNVVILKDGNAQPESTHTVNLDKGSVLTMRPKNFTLFDTCQMEKDWTINHPSNSYKVIPSSYFVMILMFLYFFSIKY